MRTTTISHYVETISKWLDSLAATAPRILLLLVVSLFLLFWLLLGRLLLGCLLLGRRRLLDRCSRHGRERDDHLHAIGNGETFLFHGLDRSLDGFLGRWTVQAWWHPRSLLGDGDCLLNLPCLLSLSLLGSLLRLFELLLERFDVFATYGAIDFLTGGLVRVAQTAAVVDLGLATSFRGTGLLIKRTATGNDFICGWEVRRERFLRFEREQWTLQSAGRLSVGESSSNDSNVSRPRSLYDSVMLTQRHVHRRRLLLRRGWSLAHAKAEQWHLEALCALVPWIESCEGCLHRRSSSLGLEGA